MNKKITRSALVAFVLALVDLAEAQQSGKIHRIGFLRSAAPPESYIEAFRQGLRELGYLEGKNIVIEYRYAEGKSGRLPDLAAELVRLPVDVIVIDGQGATTAAKNATKTIPIVMQTGDPVGQGLIASLARPGGNITGLTSISAELGGKILELLKETIPSLTRVAIATPDTLAAKLNLKETEVAAKALRVQVIHLVVRGPEDYEGVFRGATKERANALYVRLVPETSSAHRKQIVELAAKSHLPAIYTARDWVETGGLISYGPDRVDMYRRFATYVDKILKGRKPADLPVEQPMKFDFVINLQAAKAIGLTIPPEVLFRATRVIK